MIKQISKYLLTVILAASVLGYAPVHAKESGNKLFGMFKKQSLPIKEFRFRDFPHLTEFEGDKQQLSEYTKNVLQEQYKAQPNVFSSAITYGLALIDLGEYEKALKVFEQAEKDFFANDTPKIYKGWTLACLGRYKEAKELLYPIAKQRYDAGILGYSAGLWLPQHIDTVVALTLIKDEFPKKEREEIINVTEEIVNKLKSQPKLVAFVALNEINKGDLEKAKGKINYVKGLHYYPLLETLEGVIQYMEGEFEKSLVHFNNVTKTNFYSPANYLMKAKALAALGNIEEAIDEIDQVLTLDPSWEEANNFKNKLLSPRKGFFSSVASIFSR